MATENGTPQVIKFDLKTLGLANGNYRFQVKTTATGCGDSVFSEAVNYVVGGTSINAPTIRLNGNVLTIEPVTGAVRYDVYVESAKFAQTSANSIYLLELFEERSFESGIYVIKVKSIAYDGTESRFSKAVNYDYSALETLATPTVSIEGDILRINDESGLAEEFDIIVDGNVVATVEVGTVLFTVTDTSYDDSVIVCRAKEGMTWEQWCKDEEYNTGSFYCDSEVGIVYIMIDGVSHVVLHDSDEIQGHEKIIANANYTYASVDEGVEYSLKRGE